jgi:hypothetical protein
VRDALDAVFKVTADLIPERDHLSEVITKQVFAQGWQAIPRLRRFFVMRIVVTKIQRKKIQPWIPF